MHSLFRNSILILLGSGLALAACNDDVSEATGSGSETATGTGDGDGDGQETSTTTQGDGDGDPATGDGDGDMTGDGDGDGDMTGDGDGDTGDGDGDTGDGDGDTGDGDGDTGDGDGDMTGDGDGDMTGDGDGDGVCSGGCGTPNCGACPEGPEPVDVGGYTIDSTEISNAQYGQFVDVGFNQSFYDALPAGCEFKDDFTPSVWPVDPPPDLPVVGVDWCDAYAYCEWAGKELCGAIGGGPADVGDVGDWNASQWFRACTQSGIKEYPYGVLYDSDACNTIDAGFEQRTDVGSLPDCEGGYPGIYDMSGNVWEWTNACNDQDDCRRRGGSYFSDANTTRCFIDSLRARDFRNNNQGFRCCETL